MENMTTGELLKGLKHTKNFNAYIERNKTSMNATPFHLYLKGLLNRQNPPLKAARVIDKSGLSAAFGYQLFRGVRKPSRDTVLALAVGFGLNVDETQDLLRAARHAALFPRVTRDAVLIYCLERKMNISDIQELLSEKGARLLNDDNY